MSDCRRNSDPVEVDAWGIAPEYGESAIGVGVGFHG
jgi:hypothetical protein